MVYLHAFESRLIHSLFGLIASVNTSISAFIRLDRTDYGHRSVLRGHFACPTNSDKSDLLCPLTKKKLGEYEAHHV